MPIFKDEHVLIIAPGSQTTLAQLGLPESFTPAKLRIVTRMFPAEKKGEWEPLKIREKRTHRNGESDRGKIQDNGDVDMNHSNQTANDQERISNAHEDEITYEEDPTSDEDAVYPISDGKIINWSCFFALLTHIYNTLSPPFHTPIIVIAQPAWTLQDHENLTQFFFEKFKTPAFCLMDAALAACYAYAAPTATVIDVGFTKCDVTAIRDFIPNDPGRGIAVPNCGGEAMTQRLLNLLKAKGFNKEMCEQLKKNAICEVLPPGTALPKETEGGEANVNTTIPISTGAPGLGESQRESLTSLGGMPRGPGAHTEALSGAEPDSAPPNEDEEGILDVASIVASGKTSEFLAQKEKEKAAKASARKAAVAEATAAAKQTKLPNSQRPKASFYYHERKPLDELALQSGPKTDLDGEGLLPKSQPAPEPPMVEGAEDGETAPASARKEERREERRRNREGTAYIRKEIEVGTERFEAATGGSLDRIADAIHRCILSVPEINKRSDLWDALIVVGNGSRIRGFRESLLATLNAQYLISPSSATIFTSELPSNFTTPVATGANTPQPQAHHPQSHHSAGVNPLLLAATTASNATLAPPGQTQPNQPQQQQQSHQHGHSQTPTSIKYLKAPEYFPEWKEYGMEEACFLGAQVAAKVIFLVDQGVSKGYMTRTEYNDLGPQGIHESCM